MAKGLWIPGWAFILWITSSLLLSGCGAPTTPVAPTPAPVVASTATAAPTPTAQPSPPPAASSKPAYFTYTVVNVLPHDPAAFTQGLIYTDGVFYESTGHKGTSWLRKVEPATGAVLQQHDLAEEYFGEGITLLDGKIYQLTWQNRTGFVYDQATFDTLQQFSYPTEGWGITHDGARLIVSDGSPYLYFWDPATLQETGRITVTYLGEPLSQLNELEYVNGAILANVWQTDAVVRIDPATGVVDGVIDLRGLLQAGAPGAGAVDVLNGIAYDADGDRLFVTGKLWPALFEIQLVPVNQ
jgi:glutamine cyclotransferase